VYDRRVPDLPQGRGRDLSQQRLWTMISSWVIYPILPVWLSRPNGRPARQSHFQEAWLAVPGGSMHTSRTTVTSRCETKLKMSILEIYQLSLLDAVLLLTYAFTRNSTPVH
jgi:hypothetical protein